MESKSYVISFCFYSFELPELSRDDYERRLSIVQSSLNVTDEEMLSAARLEKTAYDKLMDISVASDIDFASKIDDFFNVVLALNAVLSVIKPDFHAVMIRESTLCSNADIFLDMCVTLMDQNKLKTLSMIYS